MHLPTCDAALYNDGSLRAALTLEEVFGSYVYCPRASPGACRWLRANAAILNAFTGGQLMVLGGMPVLCSAGVSTGPGLQLLRDAGLATPVELHRFHGAQDHLEQLRALTNTGRCVVVLHVHPPQELASEHSWVAPALLSWLNNKANLEALVPTGHVPQRAVMTPQTLERSLHATVMPVLLKAATDQTTGGGVDVRICRSEDDLQRAADFFADSEQVVVEEFLHIERNLCLNLAVLPDAAVRYLGAGEQVCDSDGRYHGNWFDARAQAPAAAVDLAIAIAATAAARGYQGLLGVDLAITVEGNIAVFDLNFRANGSTAALLLQESIAQRTGATVMRVRAWEGRSGYHGLLDTAYTAMNNGWLIPLVSYDPRLDGITDAPPRLVGLLLGDSREEVCEREREIAALGLD